MYFKNYTWIPVLSSFLSMQKLYKLNAKPAGPLPYRGYHIGYDSSLSFLFWVLNSPLLLLVFFPTVTKFTAFVYVAK